MARKIISSTTKPLELLVSEEDAISKLASRIEKGRNLKSTPIESEQKLESENKEYKKWNDFNKELLKRLFTTDELSEEYSYENRVGFFVLDGPPTLLSSEIKEYHEKIEEKTYRLDSILERIELIPLSDNVKTITDTPTNKKDKNKIFVVHGHNNEAKLDVARFIENLGLEPIILHEQASGSKTIIEKIEAYSNVGFGVVIYSPCDIGASASEPDSLKGRARQNVVFEHGFLIGKLGRPNVCPLVKGNLETPNDISGIVYTSMDNDSWKIDLAKELRNSGYSIDMNKVI